MCENWIFDEQVRARLMSLMGRCSPSGQEGAVAAWVRGELAAMGVDNKTDTLGNVYGGINPEASYNIALTAHMDTVGVQVVKILDGGLLLFRRMGVTPLPLAGSRVSMLTDGGPVTGIVGYDPLMRNGGEEKVSDDDLWIDIGADSRTEAERMVQVGDYGVFEPCCSLLREHKICGAGLDDRLGLFAAMEAMRILRNMELSVGVSLVGTVQEEIGLRGVRVVGANMRVDCALVVDVDFASDLPTGTDKLVGELRLGGGAGISRKATCDRALQRTIVEAARKSTIPFQINVGRNIVGGTDADCLQLQGAGVMTANVCIPCRYMHSANEMCDLRDLEAVVNLLVETVVALNRRQCE